MVGLEKSTSVLSSIVITFDKVKVFAAPGIPITVTNPGMGVALTLFFLVSISPTFILSKFFRKLASECQVMVAGKRILCRCFTR